MKKKNIPNMITSVRLVGTGALFVLTPGSMPFFLVYSLCGLSDVLDGTIARAMKCTSDFGSKLDSVADLLFYAVMLLRIFPILWVRLPRWVWRCVLIVLVIRSGSYTVAAVKFHRFASVHTYANKLTGAMLFFTPYLLDTQILTGYCTAICAVAAIASGEELMLHLMNKTYRADWKTAFQMLEPKKKS